MSATTWFILAVVGFSLAGVALIAAVLIFIKLNIPAVIGDLSGRTIAREIKAIRDANVTSGDKRHRPGRVNLDRGELTEKAEEPLLDSSGIKAAHVSKRLDITDSTPPLTPSNSTATEETDKRVRCTESLSANVEEIDVSAKSGTDILPDAAVAETYSSTTQTEVLAEGRQTELLSGTKATEVLSDTQKTEILPENRQTEIQWEGEENVTSGAQANDSTTVLSEVDVSEEPIHPISFKVIRSEVVIHSDEVI